MTNNQPISAMSGRHSYRRDRYGCNDVLLIEDTDGQCIMQLRFGDMPDTIDVAMAEAKAQMIVAALNLVGGEALPPYSDWTLHHNKQIAAIWSIEDVHAVRDDLTDDQAWKVLQRVDDCHDCEFGITWDTLRIVANQMFPKQSSRDPST